MDSTQAKAISYAEQEENNWKAWAAFKRAGCSLPYELLKYERQNQDSIRRMMRPL